MASGVEELLDMLFDMVDEAKNVPLSSDKCMIERDRALDLIDDIRAQFPVELSEAKKLMAEAGYPDGAGFPTISYTINNNSAHAAIAEYVQNVWKEVLGVDCTIDSQEFAVFLDMRSAGDYALARAGWTVDYMDPASLMELWITSSGNNDCHFYNEEYDSYISAAAHATSQNERFENFHKAEKILEEQLPIIPIYYYSEPYLMDTSKYDGFFSYLAMPVFKYVVQK